MGHKDDLNVNKERLNPIRDLVLFTLYRFGRVEVDDGGVAGHCDVDWEGTAKVLQY